MESFEDGVLPVISYPSSPEPSEVYQNLTEDSIHCMIQDCQDEEEQLQQDVSVTLSRSVSSPDRNFPNHNHSGRQQDNRFDDNDDTGSTSDIISTTPPPTTSPVTPSSSPPTGIRQSEMRTPSQDKMYRDMISDLEVMADIARSMHELARHTKSLLHTAYESVDLNDPRVRNLGMAGVLKDLRQESAHSVVDGQRAQLRYEKVLTDVRRMKRCLRNLGFWRVTGAGTHSESPPRHDTWGLPYHSFFKNDL